MTDAEILRHIDAGAKHCIRLFGEAPHMENHVEDHFSYVKPKEGEEGISFIYDIHVEDLLLSQQQDVAKKIKATGYPFWLDLTASDDVFRLFFGHDKLHGQTAFQFDDEQYLAMFPNELAMPEGTWEIRRVQSAEEFAVFAQIVNNMLADGRTDLHPVHHFSLVEHGKAKPYILYAEGVPASVVMVLEKQGIASLELVATLPAFRCHGYAAAVCAQAAQDAFHEGAELVTIRANNAASSRVYQRIGFKVYNHAI